jgi:hypothetical protein
MENEKTNSERTEFSKQSIVESFVSLSADKKWVLHKTVITDIKPVSYLQKVLAGKPKKA